MMQRCLTTTVLTFLMVLLALPAQAGRTEAIRLFSHAAETQSHPASNRSAGRACRAAQSHRSDRDGDRHRSFQQPDGTGVRSRPCLIGASTSSRSAPNCRPGGRPIRNGRRPSSIRRQSWRTGRAGPVDRQTAAATQTNASGAQRGRRTTGADRVVAVRIAKQANSAPVTGAQMIAAVISAGPGHDVRQAPMMNRTDGDARPDVQREPTTVGSALPAGPASRTTATGVGRVSTRFAFPAPVDASRSPTPRRRAPTKQRNAAIRSFRCRMPQLRAMDRYEEKEYEEALYDYAKNLTVLVDTGNSHGTGFFHC